MNKIPSNSDEAHAFLGAVDPTKSQRENARIFGLPSSTFQRWKTKAEQLTGGIDIPLGHDLAGISQLRDKDNNVVLTWYKSKKEVEDAAARIERIIDNLKDDIPARIPVKQKPGDTYESLLSCYVLTDYHIGQLSWGEEAGEDWDIEIAQDLIIDWFTAAIDCTPKSKIGVFAQLGDFLHWDGLEAVTPTGKHLLDADTRFQKLSEISVEVIERIVQALLEKHEHVHLIMAEGNHDIVSSSWLRLIFKRLYRDEPRITIDDSHLPYYAYQFGETSLFFHHGHKKNLRGISKIMAGLYREIYGKTKYSYAHTGHLHHEVVIEDELMKVKQHPTLAAKDAYSARGGYNSHRMAYVVTYSNKFGFVQEAAITPEMLK